MKKISKKIFYCQGDYPFCYYYRGYLPGVYGNQLVVSDYLRPDMDVSNVDYLGKANEADIICFQRPTGVHAIKLAKLLKLKGKKIVMDNDDTYAGIPLARLGNEKRVEIAKQLNANLTEFLKIADGVTTSTEILAQEYRQHNPNVIVLKNCIDPLDEQTCKENTTGKFRIGLIGSVTTNDDYYHIKDQIKALDARGDCTIVIMGLKTDQGKLITQAFKEDADFWVTLKNIEWHPACLVTEYMMKVADLALDLAIIPRKEHYFNQCKSNLKFLEMSLLRIPVLAQGFSDNTSPYDDIHHDYITLVKDNNKWLEYILDVKNNRLFYRDKANKAHDYVLKEYNVKDYAKTWTEEIIKLVK